MNQYRCETCKHHVNITDDNGKFRYTDCDIEFGHALTVEEEDFTCRMGCASHCNFLCERDKVLDDAEELAEHYYKAYLDGDPYLEKKDFKKMIAELRQAGEQ